MASKSDMDIELATISATDVELASNSDADIELPKCLNIVLIGSPYCGKTSLFATYRDGHYPKEELFPTIGCDMCVKNKVRDKVPVRIWDTAGNERDTTCVSIISSKADAIILCYDITHKNSYERLKFWTTECDIPNDVVMVLVGCKADLKDWSGEVPSAKAKKEANLFHPSQTHVKFFEVSAKIGYNVETVFEYARLQVMKEKGIVENEKIHSPQCVLL